MLKNKVQCFGYNNFINAFIFFIFFLHILAVFTKIRPNLISMVLLTFYNVKIGLRVKKGIEFTKLKTSSLNFVKLLIFYL